MHILGPICRRENLYSRLKISPSLPNNSSCYQDLAELRSQPRTSQRWNLVIFVCSFLYFSYFSSNILLWTWCLLLILWPVPCRHIWTLWCQVPTPTPRPRGWEDVGWCLPRPGPLTSEVALQTTACLSWHEATEMVPTSEGWEAVTGPQAAKSIMKSRGTIWLVLPSVMSCEPTIGSHHLHLLYLRHRVSHLHQVPDDFPQHGLGEAIPGGPV